MSELADDSDWSAKDATTWDPSTSKYRAVPPQRQLTKDSNRLSVYSDDSEVNPFGASSPPLRGPPTHKVNNSHLSSSSMDSGPGTNTNSFEDSLTQPTSSSLGGVDLISAESQARQLQERMLPSRSENVLELSNVAREAISAVVDAVGQQPPLSSPNATQPSLVALRVAAVVTAVRNLLYVSGTLSTPHSALHFSNYRSGLMEDVIESGRTPLMELKPFQRKVTATLSKLVLSARAAESNPTWVDGGANGAVSSMTRVDSDAAELERAVMSFVMEIGRMGTLSADESIGRVANHEKRLKGVLMSSEGLNGIGLGILGGGAAANWKGLGFAPLDQGVVPPQWSLESDIVTEMRALKALADENLDVFLGDHDGEYRGNLKSLILTK